MTRRTGPMRKIARLRAERLIRLLDGFAKGTPRETLRKREGISKETMRTDLELLRVSTREEIEASAGRGAPCKAPAKPRACAYMVIRASGVTACNARTHGQQYCDTHSEATRPIGRTVLTLGVGATFSHSGGKAQ